MKLLFILPEVKYCHPPGGKRTEFIYPIFF
jgi:hypothetical protein